MGGHVAADANLSLRLVAVAAARPNLQEAQSYASGSGSERQELKGRNEKADLIKLGEQTYLASRFQSAIERLSRKTSAAITFAALSPTVVLKLYDIRGLPQRLPPFYWGLVSIS